MNKYIICISKSAYILYSVHHQKFRDNNTKKLQLTNQQKYSPNNIIYTPK